jgi:hypothetical protein
MFRPNIPMDVALLINIAYGFEDILYDLLDLLPIYLALLLQIGRQLHFEFLLDDEGISILVENLVHVDNRLLLFHV